MGSCGDGATIPGLGLNGLAPLEDPEKSAEFMMYTYKVGYETILPAPCS
jgi:hypothetical protein